MTDLVKFLKARLDEDEERLDAIDHVQAPAGHMARERREVEAKRRIVEWHRVERDDITPWGKPVQICRCGYDLPCSTLRLLTLPYADHPDYRGEWRPD